MGWPLWTKPELDILYHFEYRSFSDKNMSVILKDRGFHRSEKAVSSKRLKERINKDVDRDQETLGYTPTGLSRELGVHHTTVQKYVRTGLLKAKPQDPDGIKPILRITRKEVRRFLIQHPEHWDHKRVDRYWLVDILTRP